MKTKATRLRKTPARPARKLPPTGRPAGNAPLTTRIVQIGNSRGVRLPKAVIEQAGLNGEVEILVRGDEVVLRPVANPRAGWEEQIRAALAEHGDDVEDWSDWQNMPNAFDEKEWTW